MDCSKLGIQNIGEIYERIGTYACYDRRVHSPDIVHKHRGKLVDAKVNHEYASKDACIATTWHITRAMEYYCINAL